MSTPIDEIPFFKGLSAQDLVSIMGITRTIQFEKDANIFNQDDPSNGCMFCSKENYKFIFVVGILVAPLKLSQPSHLVNMLVSLV